MANSINSRPLRTTEGAGLSAAEIFFIAPYFPPFATHIYVRHLPHNCHARACRQSEHALPKRAGCTGPRSGDTVRAYLAKGGAWLCFWITFRKLLLTVGGGHDVLKPFGIDNRTLSLISFLTVFG